MTESTDVPWHVILFRFLAVNSDFSDPSGIMWS